MPFEKIARLASDRHHLKLFSASFPLQKPAPPDDTMLKKSASQTPLSVALTKTSFFIAALI